METIYVLTVNGWHSKTTRQEFEQGLAERGVEITTQPSRSGDFEIFKVRGATAGRIFKTEVDLFAYFVKFKSIYNW